MDGGAWWAAVHGVGKSWTRLSNFTFTFHFHALEKEMATHSSVLAWKIPGMGEPGGLPSMGWHRVGHDWSDSAAAAAYLENMFKFTLSIHLTDLLSIENHSGYISKFIKILKYRYLDLLQMNVSVLILRKSPVSFYWTVAQRIIQRNKKEIQQFEV